MSRLRIYAAGTGQVQYDTGGTGTGKNDVVRDRFEAGVRFLADATEGRIECALTTEESGEFVARYESDTRGAGLLRECKWEIESALDKLGWVLAEDNAWFQGLGDTETVAPDGLAGLRQLRRQVHSEPPYEYAVPSPAMAVQVAKTLLTESDLRIAAGETTPRQSHDSFDVTLALDASVTGIEPTGETRRDIKRYELANLRENARTQAATLREDVPEGALPARWMAAALDAAGFEKTGVTVTAPGEGHRQKRTRTWSFLAGCLLALVVGLVAAWQTGRLSRLVELLTTSYALTDLVGPASARLPGTSAPVPSVVPLGLPVLLALPLLGNRIQGLDAAVFSTGSPAPESAHASGLKQVVIEIRSHSLVQSDEELTQILADIFDKEGIEVRRTAQRQSTRRKRIGGWLLAGAVAGGLAAFVLSSAPTVLGRYWATITSLSYVVLGVLSAYYAYRALDTLVSLATGTPEGKQESPRYQRIESERQAAPHRQRTEPGQPPAKTQPSVTTTMSLGEIGVGILVLLPILFGPVYAVISLSESATVNELLTESGAPALLGVVCVVAAGFVWLERQSKEGDTSRGSVVRAAFLFVVGDGLAMVGYGLGGLLSNPAVAGTAAVVVSMVSFLTLSVRYDSTKLGILVGILVGVETLAVALLLLFIELTPAQSALVAGLAA